MNDTSLLTATEAQDLVAMMPALQEALQAHADAPYQTVHQLWTVIDAEVVNDIGLQVSRKQVGVVVNGVPYTIPADVSPTGPPQFPRLDELSSGLYLTIDPFGAGLGGSSFTPGTQTF